MFERLAGMTGTAVTEESEFMEIYKLPVMTIPTNVPIRIDHEDVIYLTKNEKYQAIMNEIIYWHELKKPVLVGTVSVEVRDTQPLSQETRHRSQRAQCRQHQREAEIIAEAGQPGAVTIATNMAGRGRISTGRRRDQPRQGKLRNLSPPSASRRYGIPLDGLHVIGSERHESRRIDRQLAAVPAARATPELPDFTSAWKTI